MKAVILHNEKDGCTLFHEMGGVGVKWFVYKFDYELYIIYYLFLVLRM